MAPIGTNGAGRILIVDDDGDTRQLLAHACEAAAFAVDEAGSGQEAIRKLDEDPFDVMVLDLGLPDMYGVDVLKEVASTHPDLIKIILTGDPTQDSAIAALRTGAADYIRKPAEIKEVLSAIAEKLAQRALRHKRLIELGVIGRNIIEPDRKRGAPSTGKGEANGVSLRLQLDPRAQEARLIGGESRRVALTKGETAVLAAFLNKAGEVLSPQALVFEAWGDELEPEHAASIIRPIIFRLRQKLEPEPGMPVLIRTAHGAGYIFTSH